MLTTAFALIAAIGCEIKSGTAPSTDPNKPSATRKLTVTASGDHTVTQGESDKVMINVMRDNFKEPVTLEVSDLPKGVTLEGGDLTVPADQNNITIVLKADATAPTVKDHVFHVRGKSKDITSEPLNVKLTVKAK
jgi:hypothetical protein